MLKTNLTIAIFFALCGSGWAIEYKDEWGIKVSPKGAEIIANAYKKAAEESAKRTVIYGGKERTPVISTSPLPGQWLVVTSSDALVIFTLSEFVSSGKFCEWRGRHEEHDTHYGSTFLLYCPDGCDWPTVYKCSICGATRTVERLRKDSGWTKP